MILPGYDAWRLDTPPRFEDLDQAEGLDDADRPEDPADGDPAGDPAGEKEDD